MKPVKPRGSSHIIAKIRLSKKLEAERQERREKEQASYEERKARLRSGVEVVPSYEFGKADKARPVTVSRACTTLALTAAILSGY